MFWKRHHLGNLFWGLVLQKYYKAGVEALISSLPDFCKRVVGRG